MKGFVMTKIPNVALLLLMVTHFSYYTLLKTMDEELIATYSVYGGLHKVYTFAPYCVKVWDG